MARTVPNQDVQNKIPYLIFWSAVHCLQARFRTALYSTMMCSSTVNSFSGKQSHCTVSCWLRGRDWVNLSKRVGKDGVFLRLAVLLLRISLGLRPREIPRSSPASPRKTPSFPPLLLRLTQYGCLFRCGRVVKILVNGNQSFS